MTRLHGRRGYREADCRDPGEQRKALDGLRASARNRYRRNAYRLRTTSDL